MSRPLSLSIVIPAFNEERRLGPTLEAIAEFCRARPWDWEVRVVDDGSADGTSNVAESFAAQEPRVVLQREPHRGKGGAVRAGMLAARHDFRFMCDADLSMPISEIEKFLPPRLTSFGVAIGSREGQGARRVGEPLYRHLVGRVFNHAVQQLAVSGVKDSQCGFKMFTASAAETIFSNLTIDGWAFDVEVMAVARAKGFRIAEVPIEWHYRADSRLNLATDAIRMLRDVIKVRRSTYDKI